MIHISDKLGGGYYEDADKISTAVNTRGIMIAHTVMIGISTVLVATLPIYRKWIRKIKTSVDVADNAEMEAIDISGE